MNYHLKINRQNSITLPKLNRYSFLFDKSKSKAEELSSLFPENSFKADNLGDNIGDSTFLMSLWMGRGLLRFRLFESLLFSFSLISVPLCFSGLISHFFCGGLMAITGVGVCVWVIGFAFFYCDSAVSRFLYYLGAFLLFFEILHVMTKVIFQRSA